jgi:hypothetical protein
VRVLAIADEPAVAAAIGEGLCFEAIAADLSGDGATGGTRG